MNSTNLTTFLLDVQPLLVAAQDPQLTVSAKTAIGERIRIIPNSA
jgi:hypothetical protein